MGGWSGSCGRSGCCANTASLLLLNRKGTPCVHSSSAQRAGDPSAFVQYIDSYGQGKVMFGSDFPVLNFKRTRDEVATLKLEPKPLQKFLRDNAMRAYNL